MSQPLSKDALVAVVGAGAMGAGIAQVAAAAGHPVMLFDTCAKAAQSAIDGIRIQFEKMVIKGKMDSASAQAAGLRLQSASKLSDLGSAALVVEAVVENLTVKQTLFKDLEALVSVDCIFGSNTSSISITAIASVLKHPERFAGLHFFNPAPLMALVEVVSGLATSAKVAHILFATATAWGKTAVHAKSTPGFIVNRVARPYYSEALRLRTEGAADCATIDAVMRESGGFRMGPFELMDMIGLDVNFAVTRSVWNAYFNDPRYLPSLIQQELVDAGFFGKKSGRGFFDYRDGAEKPEPQTETSHKRPSRIVVCGDAPAALALAARLKAAAVTFERATSPDDRIAEADDAVLYITDGRSATQRSADNGVPNAVLMDLALDYNKATRTASTAAGQCSESGFAGACALLQTCGFQVSRLSDIPGLAVMRTVAMLANEAADAVYQGVCTPSAVDDAMRLGVNYPLGPLAWADQIGLVSIRKVLANLGALYGEDRYRISPLIQQLAFQGKNIHG